MIAFNKMAARMLAMVFLLGQFAVVLAGEELNLDETGLLMQGYDPVSYHDAGPQRGNRNLEASYQGARIHFVSEGNLERFLDDPERYMPAYGGYCAYGVRMGQKFDIDPFSYHVSGGRLYLMLDRSTRLLWAQNREHNIGIADRIWNTIGEVPAEALAAN